jgi:hypothetical protein
MSADASNDRSPFRVYYRDQQDAVTDSSRLRRRVSCVLFEYAEPDLYEISKKIEAKIGTNAPHNLGLTSHLDSWRKFGLESEMGDLLTSATVVFEYWRRKYDVSSVTTHRKSFDDKCKGFIQEIAHIFQEENAGYTINEYACIRYAIDEAFRVNLASAIGSLNGNRYKAARDYIHLIDDNLMSLPRKAVGAIEACFKCLENIFNLMFSGQNQLKSEAASQKLKPLIDKIYSCDSTAQRSMHKLLASFCQWIDGAHNYRHAPGKEDPVEPPEEVYVLVISQGLSFVRWLAIIDRKR